MGLRCISPISAYKVRLIPEDSEILADGSRRINKAGFFAEFRQFMVTPYEIDLGRERFTFRGAERRTNMDGSPIDPTQRLSAFDSDWAHSAQCECPANSAPVSKACLNLQGRVEAALIRHSDNGNVTDGYIVVTPPNVPAPWPTYDALTINGRRTAKHVAERNIETATATGIPLDALIAYERQGEDRQEVIALYEAANVPEVEEAVTVEA